MALAVAGSASKKWIESTDEDKSPVEEAWEQFSCGARTNRQHFSEGDCGQQSIRESGVRAQGIGRHAGQKQDTKVSVHVQDVYF